MPMMDIVGVATGDDFDWGGLIKKYGPTVAAGILQGTGMLGGSQQKTGYQGGIPSLTAVRRQVPQVTDPNRRPGGGGRQYFTNTRYVPTKDTTGIATTLQQAAQQAGALGQANINPDIGERARLAYEAQSIMPSGVDRPPPPPPPPTTPTDNSNASTTDNPTWTTGDGAAQGGLIGYAQGGIANLGYYLGGATDGMADKIPTTIEGKQPAKLSHGEFVIPADIVSALGSGNSSAGAKVLYGMMDRVRQHAHGTKKQIKPANPKKTLPA